MQGDKHRMGKLFGVKNLLSVSQPGTRECLTHKIEMRNKQIEAQVRGKAKVEVSIHDFELEEKGEVEDPFGLGIDFGDKVVYSHCNQNVVGGSLIEEHISNCAMKEVEKGDADFLRPAEDCEVLENSQEVVEHKVQPDPGQYSAVAATAGDEARLVETENCRIMYGATPSEVRLELFHDLAGIAGQDPKDFAQKVLKMDWEERLELIRTGEAGLNPALKPQFKKILNDANMATSKQNEENELRLKSYESMTPIELEKKKKFKSSAEFPLEKIFIAPNPLSTTKYNRTETLTNVKQKENQIVMLPTQETVRTETVIESPPSFLSESVECESMSRAMPKFKPAPKSGQKRKRRDSGSNDYKLDDMDIEDIFSSPKKYKATDLKEEKKSPVGNRNKKFYDKPISITDDITIEDIFG